MLTTHADPTDTEPTLPERICAYLASMPGRQAHFKTIAADLDAKETHVKNACWRMSQRDRLRQVLGKRPEDYEPGVYRLPRVV